MKLGSCSPSGEEPVVILDTLSTVLHLGSSLTLSAVLRLFPFLVLLAFALTLSTVLRGVTDPCYGILFFQTIQSGLFSLAIGDVAQA